MSSASEQHTDDLPSTSHDTIGKKKSRVKFPCMLCKGSHLTHLCPHMDKASKLLEDMTVSQPQLPAAYHNLSLNVDTERGVNQYQVQFKNLFQLILKPFNYIQ
jgi:hypothetical protein